MTVLATIGLWLLAAVGVLLATLILVPFGLRAEGAIDEGDVDGRLEGWWGFGLLSIRLAPGASGFYVAGLRVARFPSRDKDDTPKPEKKKREKKGRKRGPGWAYEHRQTLMAMARRLVGLLNLRGVVRGRVGLADPAATARLEALFALMRGRAPWLEQDLGCDYVEERLWLEGRLSSWVWLPQILVVALMLLARRDVRRALFSPSRA